MQDYELGFTDLEEVMILLLSTQCQESDFILGSSSSVDWMERLWVHLGTNRRIQVTFSSSVSD